MTRDGSDPTLPASADGTEATLAPEAAAAIEATMASGPRAPGSSPPVIRAGRADDYDALIGVDPKHYVVGKELARGGMGRIMTARDRRLGRPVAIKELLYESGDARARFEREARITARLQHPSIVNILEAGTWPSGEPFYAMKLVAGTSLDKVIAQKQTLAERLSLLPTIIAVVDALAYAHSMRVIHRDLKPGNILVGEFGETVVIDWGLAKDLTDTSGAPDVDVGPYREARNAGETVAGAVMGTPAYMPAEQASGETVDERADVYALGAMLYHVLAGAPPYAGKTTDELLAKVIDGPPPSLATRAPDVPPDLVTIVDKAMAHDPTARYLTASKLADDLKRFQTGQLVGAHRYSTWQLVRRWIRRHRVPVAVAAIAAVVVAVVGVVSVRSIMDERNAANRAKADAVTQRIAADQQRGEADTRRRAAQHLVDYMLIELKKQLEPIGKLKLLEGVGDAVESYFALVGESDPEATDPADRRNRAEALLLVGKVKEGKGDMVTALATYQTAQRLIEGLIATAPADVDLKNMLGLALESQGWVHERTDHPDDARAAYLATIAVKEQMIAADPAKLMWKHNLATTHSAVGWLDLNRGKALDALPSMQRSRAILLEVVAAEPDNLLFLSNLSLGYNAVAYVKANLGQLPEAIADFREAVAIATRVYDKAPDDSTHLNRLAQLTLDLGKAYSFGGQPDDARRETVRGIELTKQLIARDPENVEWAARLPTAYQAVAEIDLRAGNYRPALDVSLAGIAASDAVLARSDDATTRYFRASLHVNVVRARLGLGDAAGAATAYADAIRAWSQWHKDDPAVEHKHIAIMDETIGLDERSRGRHKQASVYFEHAIAELEPLVAAAPDDAELTVTLAILYEKRASTHLALKDPASAEAAYLKRLELCMGLYERTQLPIAAINAAYAHEGLAALLMPTRPDDAREHARTGIALLTKLQADGTLPANEEALLASLKARAPDPDGSR